MRDSRKLSLNIVANKLHRKHEVFSIIIKSSKFVRTVLKINVLSTSFK